MVGWCSMGTFNDPCKTMTAKNSTPNTKMAGTTKAEEADEFQSSLGSDGAKWVVKHVKLQNGTQTYLVANYPRRVKVGYFTPVINGIFVG